MKKKLMVFLMLFVTTIIGLFVVQSTVTSVNESLWLMQYDIFGKTIQLVDLLIGFTVSFISIMVILLGVILVNRRRMENRERIKKNLLIKYQKLLMDYIQSVEPEGEKRVLIKLMNSKFKKQLLINQIIDISKNLKGENLEKMQNLYYELKLHKRTYRKIKRGNWHNKIKGIKELCSLSLPDKKDLIIKYANSKNDILRMEAQTALVDLSRFEENPEPFKFLETLTVPFSRWEQISLYQTMLDRDIPPPNFVNWLFSDNPTVILFCLRMIREYKQIHNAEWLKNLAWHDNEDVRKLTYEVMGDLKMDDQIKEIRKLFKDETIENKRELIKSMRKSANISFISFLKKVIDNEEDAEILVEAVRAIKDTGEKGKIELDKMIKDDYKNYNIIIKHVMDRKII